MTQPAPGLDLGSQEVAQLRDGAGDRLQSRHPGGVDEVVKGSRRHGHTLPPTAVRQNRPR